MRHLGLDEYIVNLEREKMDMETLVSVNDFKDLVYGGTFNNICHVHY